jgi:peptide chain release factor 1
MLEKTLNEKKKRFEELHKLLADPKVINNNLLYRKYAKELSSLQEVVGKYDRYLKIKSQIEELKDMPGKEKDRELLEMAREEHDQLQQEFDAIKNELAELLSPESQDSDKDAIVEIRAGTGGLEASLFAADLYRMYSKLAARRNWKSELLSSNVTEKGGIKEVIFSLSGDKVYADMKFESGTHRVQRVPVTEASGRIHTSAATVAVLPEAEDVEIEIDPKDLRIDVFRASGRGGQHVNVTDSAVRITHVPTQIVVSCQDERSQHKNKAKAMRVLRARLLDFQNQKQKKEMAETRKAQVGSGDRSEKIRTYNFPDNRVTDHRINFTIHKLDGVLEGDLEELLAALKEAARQKRLQAIK